MSRRRLAVLFLLTCLVVAASGVTAIAGTDSDGDGMPDDWEASHGLNPADPSDASEDPDGDRLTNLGEYQNQGDPNDADTDADGLGDGAEVARWQSQVETPDRIIGRVSAAGRCPDERGECAAEHLFAITVILRAGDDELAEKTTLANGRFTFGDRPPGRYEVAAVAVAGTETPAPVRVRVKEDQDRPTRAHIFLQDTNGPGVVGQARQAPTCPAQRQGEDCVAPLEDAPIRVKDDAGNVVAHTTTGSDGYYAFELEPGDYKLVAKRIDGEGLPHPPRPERFTVTSDDAGPHAIDSYYDTGIR